MKMDWVRMLIVVRVGLVVVGLVVLVLSRMVGCFLWRMWCVKLMGMLRMNWMLLSWSVCVVLVLVSVFIMWKYLLWVIVCMREWVKGLLLVLMIVVGRCLGLELIVKLKSMSCMSGMLIIIVKVVWLCFIWMNFFSMMV